MTWTDDQVLAALVDVSALALTMWGEGRGDWREGNSSVEERIAIGCVVRNRLPLFKQFRAAEQSYRAVCLAPGQFSCWLRAGGASNYAAVFSQAQRLVTGTPVDDPVLEESLYLAQGIVAGVILDRTHGATFYYAPRSMDPPGRVPASAVGRPILPVGEQLFYLV